MAGWDAQAQAGGLSLSLQIRLASKLMWVMTYRPRPCCTSDGPTSRELASPAVFVLRLLQEPGTSGYESREAVQGGAVLCSRS